MSRCERVSKNEGSMITDNGEWNAPMRFFPYSELIPVFPPTDASTMPANDVGTAIQSTPRSQVAAAKPAKSVIAPPPIPTIKSERVKPAAPSQFQRLSNTPELFPSSPSGTSKTCRSQSRLLRADRSGEY